MPSTQSVLLLMRAFFPGMAMRLVLPLDHPMADLVVGGEFGALGALGGCLGDGDQDLPDLRGFFFGFTACFAGKN